MPSPAYGPIETLAQVDAPRPSPVRGRFASAVVASTLNPADYKVVQGR
ncbi:MAG: hypothetical protein ACLQVI_21445 [Polyangiaceae bacterium]